MAEPQATAPSESPVEAGASLPPSRFDRSIVDGPIAPAVWKLAWPTMLANVIGGLQGIVDHAMVGHLVGYAGNAAIGVAWQIFLVVMVFIVSLFTGMGVLVARFAGAADAENVNRTVYQAFITVVAISVGILAPLGYVLAPWLLGLVHATSEVQTEALPYLRVMFTFSVGMLVFFMLSGALRSAGDARTPLRLGLVLTLLNLVLNVIFIAGLGPVPALGTTGAAVGTVLAGFIVSIYAGIMLFRDRWIVVLRRGMSWRPDLEIIRALFRFGLPAGLQGIAMNLGGVMLLRFIGSLQQSAEAQAAYAIVYTQLFSLITWTSVGLMGATAAVAGQNLGAQRPDRTARAVHAAARIGVAGALAVGSAFLVIPRLLLALFGVDDPTVAALGVELLRYLSVSGLFVTVALVYTGGLQGTGDTRSPLHISIVSQIVVPLGLCAVLQATRGLTPADIWTAILIGHVLRCTLSVLRFRQGRWRTIELGIGRPSEKTGTQAHAGSSGDGVRMAPNPLPVTRGDESRP
jgi:putative MATE family efflux protein